MFRWLTRPGTSVIRYCEQCLSACGAACRAAMQRESARDGMLRRRGHL